MSSEIPVPVEERPWRPEDGPAPQVRTWPPGRRPAMLFWTGRRWAYAPVQARHDHADGRTVYQLLVPVGDRAATTCVRAYRWPQDGLKAAHGPTTPGAAVTHIDSVDA